MKSLFLLMLALSFVSTSAFADKIGKKEEGTEDCTKVIQQAQVIAKHNSEASEEPAPKTTPAATGSGDAKTAM